MSQVTRRYAIHLSLSNGQTEIIHFASLDDFQQWYSGVLHASTTAEAFINVPIKELDGEYLLIRANAILAIRVEPIYGMET